MNQVISDLFCSNTEKKYIGLIDEKKVTNISKFDEQSQLILKLQLLKQRNKISLDMKKKNLSVSVE